MRRCPGCFENTSDNQRTCPYCGYSEEFYVNYTSYLKPGTILSGRYTLGKVVTSDRSSVTYLAWDNAANIKVSIVEYLPKGYAKRASNSSDLIPININNTNTFDKGYSEFVAEAKRLFSDNSVVKLYDCISENNTAYMIMEYNQAGFKNQTAKTDTTTNNEQKTEITIIKAESKDNHVYELKRQFSLVPVWLKILFPSVMVVSIALIALILNGVISFTPKEEDIVESDNVVVTESITESTIETEPDVDALVMNYGEHSYACFDNADTWETAEKLCEYLGGHLVVISSREEQDAVWAFINANNCESVFIGLSDTEEEGNWQWVTGEPVEFTNWSTGQPDSANDEEDYVEILCESTGGLWNDCPFFSRAEDGKISFVCEWDCEVIGTTNMTYDDVISLLPSDFLNYKLLSADQAVTAFEYYVASILRTKGVSVGQSEQWNCTETTEDTCTFFYETESNLYIVFETDLKSGTTTSTTYTNSSCEDICGIGEYDYNAWVYIINPYLSLGELTTTDLQSYLETDIYAVAAGFEGLSTSNEEYRTIIGNEYFSFHTHNEEGSAVIESIDLTAPEGTTSIYGVVSGMNWNEIVTRLLLNGAYSITRNDDINFVIYMNDGNTVYFNMDENGIVYFISVFRT